MIENETTTRNVLPFLNWAGGKRWLASSHKSILPKSFNLYIEPFLGSGAIFFALRPPNAILSDINSELIDTYSAIRDDWKKVENILRKHHKKHSKEFYYKVRGSKPRSLHGKAAKFIYLNRTCWNGLYRVNLKGVFNVPIGTKKNVILETDNFGYISQLLENSELKSSDFSDTINKAQADDFIFVDPPYTVKHNFNNFVKYNEKLFSWNDQIRLRDCLIAAKNRGAHIFLTNANHPSIIDLYKGNFQFSEISRNSLIAAKSQKRGKTKELIIRG